MRRRNQDVLAGLAPPRVPEDLKEPALARARATRPAENPAAQPEPPRRWPVLGLAWASAMLVLLIGHGRVPSPRRDLAGAALAECVVDATRVAGELGAAPIRQCFQRPTIAVRGSSGEGPSLLMEGEDR